VLAVLVVLVVLGHGADDTVATEKCNGPCRIRKDADPRSPVDHTDLDQVVRVRLRSLRTTLGLSLDELAARTNLSPSTISRVETGKRTISLDVLVPLARALQVDLDSLLDVSADDDVVIRPAPSREGSRTTWLLSRPTSSTIALKMRLEPTRRQPDPRVHPGHDWLFVLEGRLRLLLGEREVLVETGEAAEFDTMTPHAFTAVDGPAEVLMLFDRNGHQAHTHRAAPGGPRRGG
jgi:transcriptional regulator with XRE-family HTH domain